MPSSEEIPPCPFRAYVVHSYEPYEAKEIPLLQNTVVNVLRVHPSGWWRGEYNRKSGWFPSSHVRPITDSAPIPPSNPQPVTSARTRRERKSGGFTRIQEKLTRFFSGQRAKRRDLEQRGVLASDATRVFGKSLWEIVERDKEDGVRNGIPLFLDHCFAVLWEHGFTVENLFRAPASQALLMSCKAQIDMNPKLEEFCEKGDATICGGLVKLYLREHPEPLIKTELYSQYLEIGNETATDEERVKTAISVLSQERPSVQAFISALSSYLQECVEKHSETTKMQAISFATIFGPVIITNSVENCGCNLADMKAQIACFELIISHWAEIAAGVGLKPPRGSITTVPTPSTPQQSGTSSNMIRGSIVVADYDYTPADNPKLIALCAGDNLVLDTTPEGGWCHGTRLIGGVAHKSPGDHGWFPEEFVHIDPGQTNGLELLK